MSSIETERLILRPFRESDAADVLDYLSGPLPHCFSALKLNTLDEVRAELAKRAEDTEYSFAIVLKESGKVIGEIEAEPSTYVPPGLRSKETAPPVPDTFSPSLILNVAYQGRGFAYESTYALFDYLFTKKSVRRIFAYVDGYNARSQHLCEKLGLRCEAQFLEFVSFIKDAEGNPVYEDTFQYAILKKEWTAKKTSGK